MKTSISHPIQKIEQRTHGINFGQGVRIGHQRRNYIGVLWAQINQHLIYLMASDREWPPLERAACTRPIVGPDVES